MTKESLYRGQIFKEYLLNQEFLDSESGQKAMNEHMLLGWLANKPQSLKSTIYPIAKQEFKRQWHLNQTYLEILDELSPLFIKNDLAPVLLKGITFLNRIYEDHGVRSMSDIDMLIKKSELKRSISLLEEKGFKQRKDEKWHANSHKVEMSRIVQGIETVIELHTSLFYHSEDPTWSSQAFYKSPYLQLEPEQELLFLCTHLGFQHSFLKLFWLLDIHLLLSQDTRLDEVKIIAMAKDQQVYNSLAMTVYLLNNFFDTKMGEDFKKISNELPSMKKSLLTTNFLISPKENLLRYLAVKHFCKDNIIESISYNIGWIKNRFFSS